MLYAGTSRKPNLNLGADGSGIVRNIARNIAPPELLLKGNFVGLNWSEVCASLEPKSPEEKIPVLKILNEKLFTN